MPKGSVMLVLRRAHLAPFHRFQSSPLLPRLLVLHVSPASSSHLPNDASAPVRRERSLALKTGLRVPHVTDRVPNVRARQLSVPPVQEEGVPLMENVSELAQVELSSLNQRPPTRQGRPAYYATLIVRLAPDLAPPNVRHAPHLVH